MSPTSAVPLLLTPVLRPTSAVELAHAVAALEALEIPFFVHNECFGNLWVGPCIDLYNQQTVLVPAEHAEAARQALSGVPGRGRLPPRRTDECDRSRVLAELLLFGWFLPGASVRARPLRALALALLTSILLAVALVLCLLVLALLGSRWHGMHAGHRLGRTTSGPQWEGTSPGGPVSPLSADATRLASRSETQ